MHLDELRPRRHLEMPAHAVAPRCSGRGFDSDRAPDRRMQSVGGHQPLRAHTGGRDAVRVLLDAGHPRPDPFGVLLFGARRQRGVQAWCVARPGPARRETAPRPGDCSSRTRSRERACRPGPRRATSVRPARRASAPRRTPCRSDSLVARPRSPKVLVGERVTPWRGLPGRRRRSAGRCRRSVMRSPVRSSPPGCAPSAASRWPA